MIEHQDRQAAKPDAQIQLVSSQVGAEERSRAERGGDQAHEKRDDAGTEGPDLKAAQVFALVGREHAHRDCPPTAGTSRPAAATMLPAGSRSPVLRARMPVNRCASVRRWPRATVPGMTGRDDRLSAKNSLGSSGL